MDMEMHILQGSLVRDPEIRKSQNGNSICKLRLSVGVYRTENGERRKVAANYYTLTAFGEYADFLANALHKGSPIKVYGNNLTARTYKTRDGEERADLEIIVNNGDVTVVQYAPRRQSAPQQGTLVGEDLADGSDDIPF